MNYKVIKAHQPSDPDGLVGIAGERLTCERRPTDIEGWLWCRNVHGRKSWVPEAWLQVEGRQAILQRDYTAKELTVSPGDMVVVELIQSEWALAETESGEQGWLPAACLEEMGEE